MTKVESIKESDAEALVELFSNVGPYVSARTQSDYWLCARLFHTTCLCIRDDNGHPVAALIAFRDQTPGVDEIYIQDVAVHPDHRGHGYGQALMSQLHQRADTRKVKRFWLTSEPDNSDALRLWRRLNYVNPPADYLQGDVWITVDLKGPGKDRAVFQKRT